MSSRSSRWVSGILVAVLVLASHVETQAGERDDDGHGGKNPFQRILNKLDRILDAIKGGQGQDGNHTLRWDQNLPAAQRFVVLAAFANAAVLDRETGLVWEQAPGTDGRKWSSSDCLIKTVGGRRGWRLPSIPELTSLIDPTVAPGPPSLPAGHPFTNVRPGIYWSATTIAGDPTSAFGVSFEDSSLSLQHMPKTLPAFSWCVRGPMQESVY